jgi:hypothetical protein
MEPVGCRRAVEHRRAISVAFLGQVVDLGARGVALEAGDPWFEEAGEDWCAFSVVEFHVERNDRQRTMSPSRPTA